MEDVFHDLYPELSPPELQEARANFEAYVEIAALIASWRSGDESKVDLATRSLTMEERSNTNVSN